MKTLHKRSILAVASLFAIGTAVAQTGTTSASPQGAQARPQPQVQKGFTGEHRSGVWSGESFSRLDINKDGMISREEAMAEPTIRDAWSKLDPRNAGKVSRADFDKYGMSQPASNQPPNFNSAGPVPESKPKS
jgi:hypothetical protein